MLLVYPRQISLVRETIKHLLTYLGYVPVVKVEMAAEDFVTTVNIAALYKCKLYIFFCTTHRHTVVTYKPSVGFLG